MEKTITAIWNNYGEQLSAVICEKVNHQDYCNDLLQEVYLKILSNMDKIKKAENVLPYIIKLAHNTVLDYYRSNTLRVLNNEIPEILTTSEKEENSLTCRLANSFLREMINSLPPVYRDTLIRVELEGVSQKQLAGEMGISYSGLKSRVQRARAMLRQAIVNCCDYKFDKYGNVVSCCGLDCC
jgi:RNA polymerase sigma-70 factor (ECF subfamily)